MDSSFSSILLEGDAQEVVKAFQGNDPNWSIGGFLIQDAKKILQSLSQWSIHHANRRANSIAHIVAREALKSNVESFELEHVPTCIQNIVIFEAC